MSYHATTPLTATELRAAVIAAKRQEDAVLAIYGACRSGLTPWEVYAIGVTHGRRWLIGSVRRAICNLTDEGALTQTGATKAGPHRAASHLWELAV